MRLDLLLAELESGTKIGFSAQTGWVISTDAAITPIEGGGAWKAVALQELLPDEIVPNRPLSVDGSNIRSRPIVGG